MRIAHLEDLIFENDVDLHQVMQGIRDRRYPVSIKWDGSPAVVVGNTNGYWLAFKNGYAKKEPEIFRSLNSLRDISDLSLHRIMVSLWTQFRDMGGNQIIEAEFMFNRDTIDQNHEFQPNTVRYVSEIPASFCVAVHTVNGVRKNLLAMDTKSIIRTQSPTIQYDCHGTFHIKPFKGLSASHKTKFKRWINAGIRGEIDDNMSVPSLFDFYKADPFGRHVATYDSEWDALIKYYTAIMAWKNFLLNSMTTDYIIQPANGHKHEGLVVDIGNKLVKLVNRHEFSRKNFQKERHGRQSVS